VFKTDNSPGKRARRLVAKMTASPVVPVLAYSKLIEAFIGSGSVPAWAVASVVATVLWIFGEDAVEAARREFEERTDREG